MELKTIYKFTLPTILKKGETSHYGYATCYKGIDIHVVGCGGTGSYLIQNLARLLKVKREDYNINLYLYDADVVETKNLIRQNFSNKDIGRSKAEAMAAKVSGGFQIPAVAYTKYIESETDVLEMLKVSREVHHFPIIVGCVDSMQCRKIIDSGMKKWGENSFKAVWIDSGNEEFFGQVIINSVGGNSLEVFSQDSFEEGYFNLPSFVDIAPELFTGNLQKTSEISCAEHALENVQNIGANIFSSTILFMVLNNLICGTGISSGEIKFNALLMQAINKPITL